MAIGSHSPKPGASSESAAPATDALAVLVEATLRGDEAAARRLFEAVGPIFLRAARSTLGPQHPELEDFIQEAWNRFFRSLDGFRGESRVRRYAFRIAAHVASDWIRGRSALKRARTREEMPADVPGPAEPARDVFRRRLGALLAETLSEEQLQTFLLRNALGCTIAEVAEATGAPPDTARSRLRLAKEVLQRKLRHDPSLLTSWEENP